VTGIDNGFLVVLATMDTKEAEARYLAGRLAAADAAVRVVDIGLRPGKHAWVDVDAEAVATAAGRTTAELRERARRDQAMDTMALGAATVLGRWHAEGRLRGVVAIGGNQGTSIAATAMRGLAYGIPKIIVSTVASGNVRGYVGDADITMMFSVGDLLGGPNIVTEPVLRAAVGALVGMAAVAVPSPPGGRSRSARATRPVAVTAFGNTHQAVTTAMAGLEGHGREAVVFHASGACGSAMERLIDEGEFSAVLDLTTHELLGELYPDDIYAPVRPGRLTAAGRAGIPQVVVPGGLHYHCFGSPGTIPPRMHGRAVHHHNPQNTNVRADAAELEHVAAVMAERLDGAVGPAAVLVPARGWSEVGSPGGVLHDPQGDARFVEVLTARLSSAVPVEVLDMTINDTAFAQAAVDRLLDLCSDDRPREGV
jgi:uncharacterized protein (UPF0261 family)